MEQATGLSPVLPVSYTHLDVYKRQLPVALWPYHYTFKEENEETDAIEML